MKRLKWPELFSLETRRPRDKMSGFRETQRWWAKWLRNCWSPNPEIQELIAEQLKAGRRDSILRKGHLKVSKEHLRCSPTRCL